MRIVKCGCCEGTGQDYDWNENHKPVQYIVIDCKACKGTGKQSIEMVDLRQKSKNKAIIEPISY